MPVDVIRYRHNGNDSWGIASGDRIAPIAGRFETTGDFLRERATLARELSARGVGGSLRRDEVELLSPITPNQQFLCQAINYRQHMIESGIDPRQHENNIVFRKASSCLTAANADVVRPAHVKLLDYEVELGLVIGRDIIAPVEVTPRNLHEYVAALVIVNDVSARDVQLPQGQFYKGKSYRTFGPVGPHLTLVDAAELKRLDDLHLQLWVDDELRQDGYARDLVFKPAPTLTELSGLQDLFLGDLLTTGTPGGCALRAPGRLLTFVADLLPAATKWDSFARMGEKNRRFLRPGQRMRATIRTDDGAIDLGVQENRIAAA